VARSHLATDDLASPPPPAAAKSFGRGLGQGSHPADGSRALGTACNGRNFCRACGPGAGLDIRRHPRIGRRASSTAAPPPDGRPRSQQAQAPPEQAPPPPAGRRMRLLLRGVLASAGGRWPLRIRGARIQRVRRAARGPVRLGVRSVHPARRLPSTVQAFADALALPPGRYRRRGGQKTRRRTRRAAVTRPPAAELAGGSTAKGGGDVASCSS
jgi:hypothetical protein